MAGPVYLESVHEGPMDTLLSKELIGAIAAAITFCSYLLYFRGIIFYGTVPHAITWFAWALFGGIACVGQILGNAGAGAWPTGIGAAFCLVISVIGVIRGGREIRLVDYGCLLFALVAIVFWKLSSDPLNAVIIVTVADVTVMIPTLRKGWLRPREETLSTFLLTACRHMLALLATRERSLLTMLYPSALIVSNIAFVTLVLAARKLKPDQNQAAAAS